MESSDKKNAFTCKTCASGKKQDVTHEYRALTRKRIASVSENESNHAVAKKNQKTKKMTLSVVYVITVHFLVLAILNAIF